MSDDEFDLDALLASTGAAAILAQHGAQHTATAPSVDVEALLSATADADNDDDVAAELTAADLEDEGLLSDLNSIGWANDGGTGSARGPVRGGLPRSRVGDVPPGLSAEELEILALAGDSGDDDENDDGGGSGAGRGAASQPTQTVSAEEVDARIAECLREALACKQRGDSESALAWLRSKKALGALRAEAEAGVLELRQLPPRPASGASAPSREPPCATVALAQRPAPPPARPTAQAAPAAQPPARPLPARPAAAAPPPGKQPAAAPTAPVSVPPPESALPACAAARLSLDELEVLLLGAELTPSLLPTAAPHTFATFKLSLPSMGDQEGTSKVVRASATPRYESSTVLKFERRKGSTTSAFAHRRISFELWRVPHLGVLRFISAGPAVLARAELKLAPLLTQAELHATLPLRACAGGESLGQLRVCLRLSASISAAAAAAVAPPSPPPAALPTPRAAPSASTAGGARPPAAASRPACTPAPSATRAAAAPPTKPAVAVAAATATPPPKPAAAAAAAEAMDEEDDFTHAERIASFDVLNWELEELGAPRGIYARWSSDALRLRHDALEFRKGLLEIRVSSGQLTIDAYLGELRASIAAEQQNAMMHKAQGTFVGKQRAVHALKRVKVMRDELRDAEAAPTAADKPDEEDPAEC
jgi:hypothetical protein